MIIYFDLRFFNQSFFQVILKVLYSRIVKLYYLNRHFYRQHYETMASYDDRKRSDVTVQNSGRLTSIEGSSADESPHKGSYY